LGDQRRKYIFSVPKYRVGLDMANDGGLTPKGLVSLGYVTLHAGAYVLTLQAKLTC